VYAYRDETQTGSEGDCPKFGAPLDYRPATKQGLFTLSIPGDVRVYQAVFCIRSYYPRRERQAKPAERTTVNPFPVALYPQNADPGQLRHAIDGMIYRFMADVFYLSDSQPKEFDAALQDLGRRLESQLGERDAYAVVRFVSDAVAYHRKRAR